jgi:cold shock CspA family protein
MREGIVLRYYPDRRYGFLQDLATKADFFYHRGDVKGAVAPKSGDYVRFEIGEHKGRTKAFNVTPLRAQDVLGGKAAA